eukprot:738617-Amorphochlora_amoeboformis.AAC.1
MTRSQKRHERRARSRQKKRQKLLFERMEEQERKMDTTTKGPDGKIPSNCPSREAQKPPIESVPYHLFIGVVLRFLDVQDIAQLGCVSKSMLKLCEDGSLWKELFSRSYDLSDLSRVSMGSWKKFYLLKVNQVIDRLRCFHTKLHLFEDVLGIPLQVSVNPKFRSIDYIHSSMDFLSSKAFRTLKIRTDAFGEAFTHWLPLFLTDDHFDRALPAIRTSIVSLCGHWRIATFDPLMVLDVLPKLMTTFVVLLSDKGVSACAKALTGFTGIHRLFLALAHRYPAIKTEAERRLKKFWRSEENRHKKQVRSLGDILPLLTISDSIKWKNFWRVYLAEDFDRAVLWVGKHNANLVKLDRCKEMSDAKYCDEVYEAIRVRSRLTCFFAYFLNHFCRGTTEEQSRRYDRVLGHPELEAELVKGGSTGNPAKMAACLPTIQHMQVSVKQILETKGFKQFFELVGAKAPPTKDVAHILRTAVRNSLRRGYHSKYTKFTRIQRSGVSNILKKGENYRISGSKIKSLTFTDSWRFNGSTKYLDATAICMNKKGNVLANVDFRNKLAPGINHSGDRMGAGSGSHLVNVRMDGLPAGTHSLFFVLSAWNGTILKDILNPNIRCVESKTNRELCRYDHTKVSTGNKTAVVMCRLHRLNDSWHVQAIGQLCYGRADDYDQIIKTLKKLV